MDEPVDPIAVAVAYLLDQGRLTALVGSRVAGAHRFSTVERAGADAWPTPAMAVTLQADGDDGQDMISCPDAAQERVRAAVRCWGASPAEAMRVWAVLKDLCRRHARGPVDLPDGRQALLYVLEPAGGPTAENDPDTGLDLVRGTLRLHVAALALTT